MALDPTAEALYAAVLASPRAVGAHDKPGWVGLFAEDAVVNDPVGSRPHAGRAAIERFYETFIAPNTIAFRVERDIVHPPTVWRDLTIRTTMSTGATVAVPMHLRYDLAEVDGTWRIAALAAHWELAAMIVQLLRTGLPGLAAAVKLGPQLIAQQGIAGLSGLMRALGGIGRTGKQEATRVFTAAAATDIARMRALLGAATIELPAGTRVSIEEFTNRTRNIHWHKLIAAGRTVTATIGLGDAHGIAVFDFTGRRIDAITLFLDTGS